MLKSDKVKLMVEASGAIAVLLGLVFVGLELRQNTYAVEAATFQSLTDASNEFIMSIATDAELTKIYTSGLSDVTQLSEDEYQRFLMVVRSYWVRMQNVFSQWQRGTLSDQDWRLYQAVICGAPEGSSEPADGITTTFDEHRIILSAEFQDFVDDCWKVPR